MVSLGVSLRAPVIQGLRESAHVAASNAIGRGLVPAQRLQNAFDEAVRSTRLRAWTRFTLPAVPSLYALMQGVYQVYLDRGLVLDRDVLTFQKLAAEMTLGHVFGGVREPIWPLVFVLPVRMFGVHSDIAIRLIGVAGFVFMILAFQRLARELFGRAWSIGGAFALAASPWLIYQSARGLREETAAGLLLVFCLGLVARRLTGRRFVLLFGIAGVAGLLRWDTLMIMLAVLFIALIASRPPLAAWIIGPVVVATLVAPLLIGNYIENGDPIYHSNIHARFFRNIEFHDQPGFLTSAELARDTYAGPPITWTQYVFRLHSPEALAGRALKAFGIVPVRLLKDALFYPDEGHPQGFVGTLLRAPQALLPFALLLPAVLGGISLLRSHGWPVPIVLGGTIVVYSPIADLVDHRLLLAVVPLIVLCVIEAARMTQMFWTQLFQACVPAAIGPRAEVVADNVV